MIFRTMDEAVVVFAGRGYGVETRSQTLCLLVKLERFPVTPHLLHLGLTIVTAAFWFPIWCIYAVVRIVSPKVNHLIIRPAMGGGWVVTLPGVPAVTSYAQPLPTQ
ncbi:hypothetical protein [Sinomonas mesophila]|uniref:hypothetical protein n=1 Tax=Sinomonas mesophila TaxID=1531955 RepID=UPI000987A19A|nr:hypothetical protein [Sinomonas mesophila]